MIKKKSQNLIQKPRDHPTLYHNRPAVVTLLCLARDAASRLPDGIGTRADIIELIKHSQWLKVDDTDNQSLLTVVSGALDRLHYEEDSCVKYDAEKKLWVYMHKTRTLEYHDWQPIFSDLPNSFANNSYNPNKKSLDNWGSSTQLGLGVRQTSMSSKQEDALLHNMASSNVADNSESIEGASIIAAPPKVNSSLIQIRIDKYQPPGTKRGYSHSSKHAGEEDVKRHKH